MSGASSVHWPSIGMATIAVAGLPTAWNIVARNEYRNHSIEKVVKSKKTGAYLMAAGIFFFSGLRDYFFKRAIEENASMSILPAEQSGAITAMKYTGYGMFAAGTVLVVTSFLRLGITGTYLGDYFGILMKERVTAFPFSHFENPMYLGATMNFLAVSMSENNSVGVVLTAWVALVYYITTTVYENPFTSMIYSERKDQ